MNLLEIRDWCQERGVCMEVLVRVHDQYVVWVQHHELEDLGDYDLLHLVLSDLTASGDLSKRWKFSTYPTPADLFSIDIERCFES